MISPHDMYNRLFLRDAKVNPKSKGFSMVVPREAKKMAESARVYDATPCSDGRFSYGKAPVLIVSPFYQPSSDGRFSHGKAPGSKAPVLHVKDFAKNQLAALESIRMFPSRPTSFSFQPAISFPKDLTLIS